jgi:hypothetical protein
MAMAAKNNKASQKPGTGALLKKAVIHGRWLIVGGMLVAVLGIGWRLGWNRVRDHVLADKDYQLTPKDIVITPLPAWIDKSPVEKVFKDNSLEGSLSILDEDLTVRLANAFSAHPWVAKVHRVSKQHPARVEVELTYREPVAMVEVLAVEQRDGGGEPKYEFVIPSDVRGQNVSDFVLPVDADGWVLPTDSFFASNSEKVKPIAKPGVANKYIRIRGITSLPLSHDAGENWGDPYVTGAAQIAKVLGQRWQLLGLRCIVAPQRDRSREFDLTTYELLTVKGNRIVWGRPPGSEIRGELPAVKKLKLLGRIAAEIKGGTLDGEGAPREIDLRTGDGIIGARTAANPDLPTEAK